MASFMADLRFALRNVVRQPGSSIVVAVTLALGLGLNATTLGMIDALFLRPFQFRDYDRLVVLSETVRGSSERESVAPANFLDWRADARSFERLAGWQWWQSSLTGGDVPERVQGFRVSPGFFELLGIQPASGRFFATDEGQQGNHRRIVLGDGFWRRRFGGNPGVVGTDIQVNGEPYMVVGIAPPRFAFPVGAEMWAPLAFTPDAARDRETRTLTIAGKLRPGDSLTAARAEMEASAAISSSSIRRRTVAEGLRSRPCPPPSAKAGRDQSLPSSRRQVCSSCSSHARTSQVSSWREASIGRPSWPSGPLWGQAECGSSGSS